MERENSIWLARAASRRRSTRSIRSCSSFSKAEWADLGVRAIRQRSRETERKARAPLRALLRVLSLFLAQYFYCTLAAVTNSCS